jgi:hypothetical protein
MPVVRPLPDHADLANLRKQAKSLLAAWRAGDQQALTRVRDLHPRGMRLIAAGRQSLADAQLVVARGYGFASWARLVQYLLLAPGAQALHTMDRLFQATLDPAGAPGAAGEPGWPAITTGTTSWPCSKPGKATREPLRRACGPARRRSARSR